MAATILAKIDEEELEVVRVGFVDTHGLVRARPVEARLFSQVLRNGMAFTTALLAMDSANSIFQNVFAHDGGFGRDTMGGGGDMLAMPDLATFRVLPWAHKCGWVLSDLYLKSGERCPFDPRLIMQTACERLARQGLTYVAGLEVECHIFKVTEPRNHLVDCTQPPMPPTVEAFRHGGGFEPSVPLWRMATGPASAELREVPAGELRFAPDSPLEEGKSPSEPLKPLLAGEFCSSGPRVQHQIQWFASQFPTHRNREFISA